MNQNEIKVIKEQQILGKDFKVYGDALEPLFLAKDVADMIEHSDVSKMVKAVDEDEKVKNIIPTLGGSQEMWFLTEDGLYEVLFQSRKPIAKAFKKEVKEILKQLRRTGVVIAESATDESIDYQSKYGKYRIRKTFSESKDLRATYEEFTELSKIERAAKRIDNKDRIKSCKIIINVLEEKIANEVLELRPSELMAIRELIGDIQSDITKLSNKLNGGQKSAMTKRINKLEEQVQSLSIHNKEFYLIEKHPFSKNYMHIDLPGGKKVCTKAYKAWINNLHLEDYLPEIYPGLDLNKPMRATLLYGHMDKFDTINFEESIIDQVSKYLGFNDRLINSITQELYTYVDSYEEGFIYICLENIEDVGDDDDR